MSRTIQRHLLGMRGLFLLLLTLAAPMVWALDGSIRLNIYPGISVADGRSTVTVSAEVRMTSGSAVPDGTQVRFETTLGSFDSPLGKTVNGLATATMRTGSIPGFATVSASALTYSAFAKMEIELVKSRRDLSSAKEYIEVVAPSYLNYSQDHKIIAAAGENRGVRVRYKDVEIQADDVQIRVPLYELRARKALVKWRGQERFYQQIFLKLNARTGYGITRMPTKLIDFKPGWPAFGLGAKEIEAMQVVMIKANGVEPWKGRPADNAFEFTDISETASRISAKKATAYPNREIQFHRADIFVNDQRVLRMPLFTVTNQATRVVTDQYFSITNNQLAVDYPYYLTLKPGETSLFRIRSGQRYGATGTGAIGGTFLDYELRWNRGDEMDGGITVSGLGRKDMGTNLRQYWRLDDRTSFQANVNLPENRSLFANTSLSRQFNGFQVSLNSNYGRPFRGPRFTSEQYGLLIEKDPMKLGKLPINVSLGLTGTHQKFSANQFANSQTGAGAQVRSVLQTRRLDRDTNFDASFTVGKQYGRNVSSGLNMFGQASLSRYLGRGSSIFITYDYTEDSFTSSFLGRHRLGSVVNVDFGALDLSIFGGRTLDSDRTNLVTSLSLNFSRSWRIGTSYSLDRYSGLSFTDYSFVLGYRIGYREIGLSWSARNHRIGIEVGGF